MYPFTGSISEPSVVTLSPCPGYPYSNGLGTLCSDPFTITLSPGAGEAITRVSVAANAGCGAGTCAAWVAGADATPASNTPQANWWCAAGVTGGTCTAATSQSLRVYYNTSLGLGPQTLLVYVPYTLANRTIPACDASYAYPCIPGGGTVPGTGEVHGQIQSSVPTAAAAPTTLPAATSLAVSVTTPGLSGPVAVGQPVAVSGTVTALGGPVSSISLNEGSTSKDISLVGAKVPPPFSLSAGSSKTFAFNVSAANPGVQIFDLVADGTSSTGAAVEGSGLTKFKVGGSVLVVKVTPTPGTVRLVLKGDSLVPRPITVNVSVTNTGKAPVLGAALQPKMIIGYLGTTPTVPSVPVRGTSPPVPATLGTIAPGKTVSGTYKLLAEGDGDYSLQALVVGAGPSGARVAGVGTGQLHLTSPVLLMATGYSAGASLPGMHGLVISGTPFTIPLTFENLSYVHRIVVSAFSASFTGNAFGGQIILGSDAVSALNPAAVPVPPEFMTLAPRQTLEAEAVLYTAQSQGILQNAGKVGVGGTRART